MPCTSAALEPAAAPSFDRTGSNLPLPISEPPCVLQCGLPHAPRVVQEDLVTLREVHGTRRNRRKKAFRGASAM